jgi:hypothetical protein
MASIASEPAAHTMPGDATVAEEIMLTGLFTPRPTPPFVLMDDEVGDNRPGRAG